jgi:hypothetical protein
MAAAAGLEAAVKRVVALRALVLVALLCASASTSAATYALVVSGLGGDPDYEHRFAEWNASLTKAVTQLAGAERVTSLAGTQATAAGVEKAVQLLAQRLKREDAVMVVLLGHGSWFGDQYRYNLTGPDLTGAQLKALLDRLPAERQLVVNATSASGAVVDAWKKQGRIVITATRTGGERNATRFAQYFIDALTNEKADRDKDQVVTAAEAFAYANEGVTDAFKADAAIVSEHARLDGGDAAHFVVARFGNAAQHSDDSQLLALQGRQQALEQELAAMKARKSAMPEDAYYAALEPVLVRIAQLGGEREARELQLGMTPTGATP